MILVNFVYLMIFGINIFLPWDENVSSYKININHPMERFLLV